MMSEIPSSVACLDDVCNLFLTPRLKWPRTRESLSWSTSVRRGAFPVRVNEKAVLHDKSVEQELIRRYYVLLRADWTRYDPEITSALNKVGRNVPH